MIVYRASSLKLTMNNFIGVLLNRIINQKSIHKRKSYVVNLLIALKVVKQISDYLNERTNRFPSGKVSLTNSTAIHIEAWQLHSTDIPIPL